MYLNTPLGKSECTRCHGRGCFSCERRGYVLQCPNCCNLEYQEPESGHFRCLVCNLNYNKDGEIITENEDEGVDINEDENEDEIIDNNS